MSTPGVFLPLFSVTLLTANVLPLNEWVSRCWRAFTFPHLPSCVAFTIRACSLLTFAWHRDQSIWFQFTFLVGGAQAVIGFVRLPFAFLLSRGSVSFLVMKDHAEVCPVSRGMMLLSLNPYPPHYRVAFAFSAIRCLHLQQCSLRFTCPLGQRCRFTMFRITHKRMV